MVKAKKQVAVPEGAHKGVISGARETTKTFDQSRGPEPVVELVITPEYRVDGAETLPLSVIFTPVLNGLSALSKLLERLDREPEDGSDWKPETLVGTKVAFVAAEAENGFVRILKDTIRAA